MPIYIKGDTSILFIHVPKTGGSSVEQVFRTSGYAEFDRDPHIGAHTPNRLRRCSPQHWHGETLRQVYRISEFSAVFMIVRDPVKRLRSEYAYQLFFKANELTEESVATWTKTALQQYRDDPFVLDNHIRPQCDFWIPEALVYRHEDGLRSAVEDLNARFTLSLDVDVPHLLRASDRDGGVESDDVPLTDDVVERLKTFYQEDYRKFHYEWPAEPSTMQGY